MRDGVWESEVIRVRTPDGTLYAIIMLNDDRSINSFRFSIGKAGIPLSAWAEALAAIMTLVVQKGATLEEMLTVLSGITSDGKARTLDTTARSGPEGVWQALMEFRRGWPEDREEDNRLLDSSIRGASVGLGVKQRSRY